MPTSRSLRSAPPISLISTASYRTNSGSPWRDPVRRLAERHFSAGAVFTPPPSGQPMLVGDLRWSDADGLLLFAANGDDRRDAHFLRFDTLNVSPEEAVVFMHVGQPVGRLQCIDRAELDDADDFRIGWQLWQCVAPLRRAAIDRWFEQAEQQARSR